MGEQAVGRLLDPRQNPVRAEPIEDVVADVGDEGARAALRQSLEVAPEVAGQNAGKAAEGNGGVGAVRAAIAQGRHHLDIGTERRAGGGDRRVQTQREVARAEGYEARPVGFQAEAQSSSGKPSRTRSCHRECQPMSDSGGIARPTK